MKVRVRVAPSPTGYPHLGLVYQAMFDWVFAKKFDGKFILRIEDTDRGRFVEDSEAVIYSSLEWAKLLPDEGPREGGKYGPYRQSERLDHYQKYANQLLQSGHAYRCFCTKERLEQMHKDQEAKHQPPKYDRTCLKLTEEQIKQKLDAEEQFTIRMKIPEGRKISVQDGVVGEVVFDSSEFDDQVILKSDGFPTYHLAVVVDDYLMKITHVFRGTEWLPSTPKHVLLWEYLGWIENMPKFIHVPVLLNSDGGGKLSKRHSHASVEYYRKEGFLPEAVVNYLANIVWNHPQNKEIFSIEDFGYALQLEPLKFDIRPNGVRFDLKKLGWMNGEYIRQMSDSELVDKLEQYLRDISEGEIHPAISKLKEIVPLIKERIKKLSDFVPLTDFLFESPEYEQHIFRDVAKKDLKEVKEILEEVKKTLEGLNKPWSAEEFEKMFREFAQKHDLSTTVTFQLIRVAISGQTVTPPLFESIKILGEDETLNRFSQALSQL